MSIVVRARVEAIGSWERDGMWDSVQFILCRLFGVSKPDLFGRLLPERQLVRLERKTAGLQVRVLAWPAKVRGNRHWGQRAIVGIRSAAYPRGRLAVDAPSGGNYGQDVLPRLLIRYAGESGLSGLDGQELGFWTAPMLRRSKHSTTGVWAEW